MADDSWHPKHKTAEIQHSALLCQHCVTVSRISQYLEPAYSTYDAVTLSTAAY